MDAIERTRTFSRRLEELSNDGAKNEPEINAILEQLANSPINFHILQATKIGVTVNNVRKRLNGHVSANSGALAHTVRLLQEWKDLAKQHMQKQTDGAITSPSPAAAVPLPAPLAASATTPAATTETGEKRKLSEEAESNGSSKKHKSASNGSAVSSSASSSTAAAASSFSSLSPSPLPPATPPHANVASPMSVSPARVSTSPSSMTIVSPSSRPTPPPAPAPTPGPSFYNPNLHQHRSQARASSTQRSTQPVDHTSRKRTSGSDSFDAYLAPLASGGHGAPVRLCSLHDMCCDYMAAHLDQFTCFEDMPVSSMLRILTKANAEQLIKFEKHNPRLLGETEHLWRGLCKRLYPSAIPNQSDSSATLASGTWKSRYQELAQKKESKLASISERLKRMQQSEKAMKKEASIKTISMQAAIKLENQSKKGPVAPTPSPPLSAAATAQQARFNKLKQQARAISGTRWNGRPK